MNQIMVPQLMEQNIQQNPMFVQNQLMPGNMVPMGIPMNYMPNQPMNMYPNQMQPMDPNSMANIGHSMGPSMQNQGQQQGQHGNMP